MNHRSLRNRFTALAVLLQVFATFAASSGLVLCVGTAGHVAVEDYAATSHCCPPAAPLAADTVAASPDICSAASCIDTPLLGPESVHKSSTLRFATTAPALVTVTGSLPLDGFDPRAAGRRQSSPDSAAILRSVILLI